jgi:HEPN domain-containing protein
MAPEPASEWLAVAEDDLRQVVNNLEGPFPSMTGAAYHCQQAAEKLVKAVLARAGIDFPRTHDIGALVGMLPKNHALAARLAPLRDLTPYAVAYRYPAEDAWDPPKPQEIAAWLADLRLILADIHRR